jgi:hypothetical protein
MTFFLRPSALAQANRAVEQALVSSGYRLVGERSPHDAELKLEVVALDQHRSAAQGSTSGVSRARHQMTLSLTVVAEGRTLDQRSAEIVFANGVTPADVQPLIAALNASDGLEGFARQRKARGDSEAKRRAAEGEGVGKDKDEAVEQAHRRAEAESEAAWSAARPADCASASTASACDALSDWAKKHETGAHVEEARGILKDAEPKVRLLREAAAWRDAQVDTCKAPKGANDCAGVENYLRAFGNDEHSQQARDLLASSSKKIAALTKQEEAQAQREAARQKAEELRVCNADCTSKEGYCRQSGAMRFDPKDFQDCSAKCLRRCTREVGK